MASIDTKTTILEKPYVSSTGGETSLYESKLVGGARRRRKTTKRRGGSQLSKKGGYKNKTRKYKTRKYNKK